MDKCSQSIHSTGGKGNSKNKNWIHWVGMEELRKKNTQIKPIVSHLGNCALMLAKIFSNKKSIYWRWNKKKQKQNKNKNCVDVESAEVAADVASMTDWMTIYEMAVFKF